MFLLPWRLSIPKNSNELDNTRKYTDYNWELKEYSIYIRHTIEKLITKDTTSWKIKLGQLNWLFSIELYLWEDWELFNIWRNTYLKWTEINQIIISNLKPTEEDLETEYISPKLDNHPTDLNWLRQLDEDIYLFSMNKKQSIFTSKFKENIRYVEVKGINYAIWKSLISWFIWIYSLSEDKRITTDKDKILKVKIDNKHEEKHLKIKKNKSLKIGPFIMWEYF
jgi:hypothetical protein